MALVGHLLDCAQCLLRSFGEGRERVRNAKRPQFVGIAVVHALFEEHRLDVHAKRAILGHAEALRAHEIA